MRLRHLSIQIQKVYITFSITKLGNYYTWGRTCQKRKIDLNSI
jgi:hypothetical protein